MSILQCIYLQIHFCIQELILFINKGNIQELILFINREKGNLAQVELPSSLSESCLVSGCLYNHKVYTVIQLCFCIKEMLCLHVLLYVYLTNSSGVVSGTLSVNKNILAQKTKKTPKKLDAVIKTVIPARKCLPLNLKHPVTQ